MRKGGYKIVRELHRTGLSGQDFRAMKLRADKLSENKDAQEAMSRTYEEDMEVEVEVEDNATFQMDA